MQLNLFKKLPGLKEINDTRKKVLSQDNEKKFFSSVSKLTRGKINLGSVKRPIAEVLRLEQNLLKALLIRPNLISIIFLVLKMKKISLLLQRT